MTSITSHFLPVKQSGFSLIELLISFLIFAIGILGVASLQHVSMKLAHDSALQNTAIMLSDSLIEQLRATDDSVNLSKWQEQVKNDLPGGTLTLADQGNHYQLKIQWHESEHSDDQSQLQSYEISFKLHP
jgi:type IV pilus assembly protein PilV